MMLAIIILKQAKKPININEIDIKIIVLPNKASYEK